MLNVSAKHISPKWTLSNVAFADVTAGEWGDYRVNAQSGQWYAIAPQFGCGHYCATIELAIKFLLMANGCHSIEIKFPSPIVE